MCCFVCVLCVCVCFGVCGVCVYMCVCMYVCVVYVCVCVFGNYVFAFLQFGASVCGVTCSSCRSSALPVTSVINQ